MKTRPESVHLLSRLCKALADDTRLHIVALLTHGELCVCHVQEALGQSQPNISQHLAVLRAAGVVAKRREGTWTWCRLLRLSDPTPEGVLREMVQVFSRHDGLRRQVRDVTAWRVPRSCEAVGGGSPKRRTRAEVARTNRRRVAR